MLHGLEAEGALTGDLFAAMNDDAEDRARWENVSKTIDDLRSRFGGMALSLDIDIKTFAEQGVRVIPLEKGHWTKHIKDLV